MRFLALSLSFFIFVQGTLFAYSAETNFWETRRLATASRTPYVVPRPPITGTTYDVRRTLFPFETVRGPSVIHIQDIHQNLEAQQSIADFVEEKIRSGKVDAIALEGAWQTYPAHLFKTFPHPDAVHSLANDYFNDLKISGPIFSALKNSDRIPALVGVDDRRLYEHNVEAFRRAHPFQKEMRERLRNELRATNIEKGELFNPQLMDFDRLAGEYHQGRISLVAYLTELKRRGGKSSEAIRLFLEAADPEKTLDRPRIESQRIRILHDLQRRLTPDRLSELGAVSQAFSRNEIDHAEFYRYLQNVLTANKISLDETPAFADYLRYVLLSDDIDAEAVLADVQKIEKSVYDKLIQSDAERRLVEKSRWLTLAGKLVNFELTSLEWREYSSYSSPLVGEARRGEFGFRSPPPNLPSAKGRIRRGGPPGGGIILDAFEAFYQLAQQRDQAMFTNLNRLMKNEKVKNVLLVTGGFHSHGMKPFFDKKDWSYSQFRPTITKINSSSDYLNVFLRKKTPLEKLMQREKLFLATNPFPIRNFVSDLTNRIEAARDHFKSLIDETTLFAAIIGGFSVAPLIRLNPALFSVLMIFLLGLWRVIQQKNVGFVPPLLGPTQLFSSITKGSSSSKILRSPELDAIVAKVKRDEILDHDESHILLKAIAGSTNPTRVFRGIKRIRFQFHKKSRSPDIFRFALPNDKFDLWIGENEPGLIDGEIRHQKGHSYVGLITKTYDEPSHSSHTSRFIIGPDGKPRFDLDFIPWDIQDRMQSTSEETVNVGLENFKFIVRAAIQNSRLNLHKKTVQAKFEGVIKEILSVKNRAGKTRILSAGQHGLPSSWLLELSKKNAGNVRITLDRITLKDHKHFFAEYEVTRGGDVVEVDRYTVDHSNDDNDRRSLLISYSPDKRGLLKLFQDSNPLLENSRPHDRSPVDVELTNKEMSDYFGVSSLVVRRAALRHNIILKHGNALRGTIIPLRWLIVDGLKIIPGKYYDRWIVWWLENIIVGLLISSPEWGWGIFVALHLLNFIGKDVKSRAPPAALNLLAAVLIAVISYYIFSVPPLSFQAIAVHFVINLIFKGLAALFDFVSSSSPPSMKTMRGRRRLLEQAGHVAFFNSAAATFGVQPREIINVLKAIPLNLTEYRKTAALLYSLFTSDFPWSGGSEFLMNLASNLTNDPEGTLSRLERDHRESLDEDAVTSPEEYGDALIEAVRSVPEMKINGLKSWRDELASGPPNPTLVSYPVFYAARSGYLGFVSEKMAGDDHQVDFVTIWKEQLSQRKKDLEKRPQAHSTMPPKQIQTEIQNLSTYLDLLDSFSEMTTELQTSLLSHVLTKKVDRSENTLASIMKHARHAMRARAADWYDKYVREKPGRSLNNLKTSKKEKIDWRRDLIEKLELPDGPGAPRPSPRHRAESKASIPFLENAFVYFGVERQTYRTKLAWIVEPPFAPGLGGWIWAVILSFLIPMNPQTAWMIGNLVAAIVFVGLHRWPIRGPTLLKPFIVSTIGFHAALLFPSSVFLPTLVVSSIHYFLNNPPKNLKLNSFLIWPLIETLVIGTLYLWIRAHLSYEPVYEASIAIVWIGILFGLWHAGGVLIGRSQERVKPTAGQLLGITLRGMTYAALFAVGVTTIHPSASYPQLIPIAFALFPHIAHNVWAYFHNGVMDRGNPFWRAVEIGPGIPPIVILQQWIFNLLFRSTIWAGGYFSAKIGYPFNGFGNFPYPTEIRELEKRWANRDLIVFPSATFEQGSTREKTRYVMHEFLHHLVSTTELGQKALRLVESNLPINFDHGLPDYAKPKRNEEYLVRALTDLYSDTTRLPTTLSMVPHEDAWALKKKADLVVVGAGKVFREASELNRLPNAVTFSRPYRVLNSEESRDRLRKLFYSPGFLFNTIFPSFVNLNGSRQTILWAMNKGARIIEFKNWSGVTEAFTDLPATDGWVGKDGNIPSIPHERTGLFSAAFIFTSMPGDAAWFLTTIFFFIALCFFSRVRLARRSLGEGGGSEGPRALSIYGLNDLGSDFLPIFEVDSKKAVRKAKAYHFWTGKTVVVINTRGSEGPKVRGNGFIQISKSQILNSNGLMDVDLVLEKVGMSGGQEVQLFAQSENWTWSKQTPVQLILGWLKPLSESVRDEIWNRIQAHLKTALAA